jgi:hypothetical protein
VRLRDPADNNSDSLGSGLEFAESELRQHQSQLANYKCLKQAARGLSKLVVFAATQDRGVRVDPWFHRRILLAVRATSRLAWISTDRN